MNTRVQVARSMVWTALESFGISGLAFIGLIVFARYVSVSEYGVAAMAQGIVQLLTIPVEFLFVDALIRRKDAQQIDFDTAHTFSVLLGILITFLCWLWSGTIAGWLNAPEMAPVLSWMSLSIAAMGFGAVIIARQRREMEFRILAIRSFVGRLGGITVGIIVAIMGGGVWSLVTQQVLMVAFSTFVLWMQANNRPSFNFSYTHFKELAGFGLRTLGATFLSLSVPRGFTIFVGACINTTAAGYLNLAFRLVDMLRDIAMNVVQQLALPMFARHSDDTSQLKKIYTTAVGFTCMVAFPAFAGFAVCSADIIPLLCDKKWLDAVPYVTLLCYLTLVHFSRLYSNSILTARGFPQLPLVPDFFAMIFVLIGMTALQLSGTMTLALAATVWALRLLVSVPIDMVNVRKVVHISFYEQIEGALVPLASAFIMCACLYALQAAMGSFTPIPRLIVMCGSGAVVYAASLWTLDKGRIKELLHFAMVALKRQEAPL